MSDIAVIIGLGYVGLPLAREATRSGLHVMGLDVNEETVAGLEGGRSHIDDLTEAGRSLQDIAQAQVFHLQVLTHPVA